jgi:DNA modification methylase
MDNVTKIIAPTRIGAPFVETPGLEGDLEKLGGKGAKPKVFRRRAPDPVPMVGTEAALVTDDCLAALKRMATGSVPVFFFSPPYNKHRNGQKSHMSKAWAGAMLKDGYATYSDDMTHDAYVAWMKAVLTECWRVLRDDGVIFFQHKDQHAKGRLLTPDELIPGDLIVRQRLIWDRCGSGMNFNTSFLRPTFEYIHVIAKPAFRFGVCGTLPAVLKIEADYGNDHPASFPVELPRTIFKALGPDHDLVVDIFSGSGSTGVAALAEGMDYIGVELAAEYNAMAAKRLGIETPSDLRQSILVEADPVTVKVVPVEADVGPVANDCEALSAVVDPDDVSPGLPYRASADSITVLEGDNLAQLKTMADNSVDSVVTDPPYGLKFMGKSWDHDVPTVEFWTEVYRVLKPGGYVLSFSGTRTYHRMTVAIEDAGFDIVDQISWLYGQGFPKSRNVAKDIDRILGAQREVVGRVKECGYDKTKAKLGVETHNVHEYDVLSADPITQEAKRFHGYGTALKPAQEPICVARKPHKGSIAKNMLEHGVGALNIDACRVGTDGGTTRSHQADYGNEDRDGKWRSGHDKVELNSGRWPANVIHDGSETVLATFPHTKTGKGKKNAKGGFSEGWRERGDALSLNGGDEGSAARYFYCAKPSKAEKGVTSHVTVKPVALMRYLVKLATPAGGVVLDPFAGSGTTGIAAAQESFRAILMERDPVYAEDIRRRMPLAA